MERAQQLIFNKIFFHGFLKSFLKQLRKIRDTEAYSNHTFILKNNFPVSLLNIKEKYNVVHYCAKYYPISSNSWGISETLESSVKLSKNEEHFFPHENINWNVNGNLTKYKAGSSNMIDGYNLPMTTQKEA